MKLEKRPIELTEEFQNLIRGCPWSRARKTVELWNFLHAQNLTDDEIIIAFSQMVKHKDFL